MRKAFTIFLAAFIMNQVYSQCENTYYPTEEGTTWEITNYNKKDKPQGKSINKIVESKESSEESYITVNTMLYDNKDEVLSEGNYEVICEGGTIKVDLENFLPTSMLEQYENMDVEFEGDHLEFPEELSIGEILPESSGKMTVTMSEGAMGMTSEMDFLYKDRKVESKETITTPAGTFDCLKITQTIVSSFSMMGMEKTTEFASTSWVTKGYGMVKNESYDKKGKLTGYSLLTSFSK